MARLYLSDRTREKLPNDEVTTLKVAGPLASMTGRRELHLSKPEALAFARWLGFPLARPEIPDVPGPGAHPDGSDPFAVRLDGPDLGSVRPVRKGGRGRGKSSA